MSFPTWLVTNLPLIEAGGPSPGAAPHGGRAIFKRKPYYYSGLLRRRMTIKPRKANAKTAQTMRTTDGSI